VRECPTFYEINCGANSLLTFPRDYVFSREARELKNSHGQTCYVVILEAEGESDEPIPSGVVRVKEYKQSVVFCPGPDPENQVGLIIYSYDEGRSERRHFSKLTELQNSYELFYMFPITDSRPASTWYVAVRIFSLAI
jgi:hypothetical protein